MKLSRISTRLVVYIIIAVIVIAGGSVASVIINGKAAATPLTFTPVADSYVNSYYPTINFGTLTELHLQNSPTKNGYLRFTCQRAERSTRPIGQTSLICQFQ